MFLKNEKGMSLVQVLMGLGFVGALALVIAQLGKMGANTQKHVQQAQDLNEIMRNISISLKDQDLCNQNLKDKRATDRVAELFTNADPSAEPYVKTNKKRMGMRVDRIETVYTGAGNAELKLTFTRGSEGVRVITKTLQMKMTIETKGEPLLADFDPMTDKIENCYAVGGIGGDGLTQEDVELLIEASTAKYSWCGPTSGACPANMTDVGEYKSIITGAPEVTCKGTFTLVDDAGTAIQKSRALENCANSYSPKPVLLNCDITNLSGDAGVAIQYERAYSKCHQNASKNLDLLTGQTTGSLRLCCI